MEAARRLEGATLLDNAERQVRVRGLDQIPIVDVDAHHFEQESWQEIAAYVDRPLLRRVILEPGSLDQVLPGQVGIRRLGGRIKRHVPPDPGVDAETALVRKVVWANRKLGIRYCILFPTAMLTLGVHPSAEVEVAVARAYARWMTERILPDGYRYGLRSMLYLPVGDPEEALRILEEFGARKGVVGVMITGVRYTPIIQRHFLKVLRAVEERQLPVALHPVAYWQERAFEQLNRFLGVHALGFPLYNMIHMTNILINGLPERFPGIRWIFLECGLTYLVFLRYRLDSEYVMRVSEAPLLRKLPSQYMAEFYYSTQPLELFEDEAALRWVVDQIGGPARLLYSSDYPHWDFDPPWRIWDLRCFNEEEKRAILGGNAMRLFSLDRETDGGGS
jgi:predicted TIM-barrel fold metal-dependent hydrolase